MSDPSRDQTIRERVVRVFISSTFRDMVRERDELVRYVFPQLRKLCEQRGVTWGVVDLRWGITEQQTQRGEVLPIILVEIERCRPYFIGLLGERYGWVPEEISDDMVVRQKWLAEHRDRSVTELEMLHGVLNSPAMANRSYFYFRDPVYVESVPTDSRDDFIEPDPDKQEKLADLKHRIRDSGLPLHDNYADPEALGKLILHDLTTVINQEFPPGSEPDPLDREAAEHDVFAQSRCGLYIGRQEYFDRLDAHAAGADQPLAVVGESGGGKSALLANWATGYQRKHPDELVLMHFIGGTPSSADWAPMLRRIMGELKRRFGIEQDIPDKPDELRAAFAHWLSMAAARGRVVLVLDALNQLEDRDQAPDLVWLPPVIPDNVRLVVSTLPGRPLDELTRRNWPTLTVEPLASDERQRLIVEYLAQSARKLSGDQIDRIASAPQSANPLFLRAMLDELRVVGVHERLDEQISGYLDTDDLPSLFEKILTRWQQDYERDRPGLVADAMRLIWAARRGLSEAELMDLLGHQDRPLPRAHWSPLFLAVEHSLVNRSGLITFFHDYLRQAVQHKYLPTDEQQADAHLRLGEYFSRQDLNDRRIDEQPWHLVRAKAWRQLYDLLADLPFFEQAWQADQWELKAYWAQVETRGGLWMVDAYRGVIDSPEEHQSFAWRVAMILNDTGHPVEAMSLREYLVEHYRRNGDQARLQRALGNQALILRTRGDLDGAMSLHKEKERICRELGNKAGLQASLGSQGLILAARGDLDGAMSLHKEQERICRELGNKTNLQVSLGNQALILKARGDLERRLRC